MLGVPRLRGLESPARKIRLRRSRREGELQTSHLTHMKTSLSTAQSYVEGPRPALMHVRSLTKRFGEQYALHGVSFEIRSGEVLGLIGPNGAGKTTMLDAIAGLMPGVGGEVIVDGEQLPQWRRRESLFFLPDGLRPWDEQFVLNVIEFFAGVFRRSDAQVAEAIHAVGLAPMLQKRVKALSKGYARRLMLALAVLTPQPLLLLDEPFDGFDLRQTRDIMKLIRG